MICLDAKLAQWERVSNKNSKRAKDQIAEQGTCLEMMVSENHYMTEVEKSRWYNLQIIYQKLSVYERRAASERIKAKRLKRKTEKGLTSGGASD